MILSWPRLLAVDHQVHPQLRTPTDYHLTGFTYWEGPDGGALDDDVIEFLDAGPAPVVVTLGTSGASARPEVFSEVAACLDDLGKRGIFLTSNAAVTVRVRGEVGTAHGVWQFVPLAPLLRQAEAVVHSGAHGTNALAMAAGLPSAIVPCMSDQQWHAQRQQELGTGLWVRRMRDLPAAVRRIVSDSALSDAAAGLAVKLRVEDGTGAACDAIEAALPGRGNV